MRCQVVQDYVDALHQGINPGFNSKCAPSAHGFLMRLQALGNLSGLTSGRNSDTVNTSMSTLPSGTVTFLFTDIQGSTQMLHRLGATYGQVLEEHRQLMREAFAQHNGHEVDTQGDAFFVAFQRGGDAVAATVAAQRALHSHPWPQGEMLRVRMGLHTGEPGQSAGGYFGIDVHRGARVMSAGHGGQVLLSQTAHALAQEHLPEGVTLRDLGEHRLKDLIRAEHLYDLVIEGVPSEFPALKTLSNHSNNLPLQVTSFVGREAQITEVEKLLTKTRLLTLTGSGGTGKTRLSLQVGAELLEEYSDGVFLVELAPVRDPDLVPQAVASALGVREEVGHNLMQTLGKYLASKKLLLLVDNCEHLLSAAALLVDTLLRSCAGLRILASSREGLGIAGEQIYRVPSLSLPNPRETASPETLGQCEAVRLFVERALAVSPTFAITAQNASALAQLCARLDGIPLAIELAAARMKALSVEKLLERLDDRFRLLTGGSRTALPRQQTLRALIDWSYDLLGESERALLQRLSIFAGGWTLEGAESVCADDVVEEWEVLDLLTGLVDKSLVAYEEEDERYRLLETVRQYARDRLLERGEAAIVAVRERHIDFCVQLAEAADAELKGPQSVLWLGRLEQEHDNMRAALAWCQGNAQAGDSGLRLGAALDQFWRLRGYWSEGREHLSTLLADAGSQVSQSARAQALMITGKMASLQGDYASARALYEESLAMRRELGDKQGMANSLRSLGIVASNQGDFASARPLYEESLAVSRDLGDKRGLAQSLHDLGKMASLQGDYANARALLEESLAIQKELGNKQGVADSLGSLGFMAFFQGDYANAHSLQEELLAIWRESGDKSGLALTLSNLGYAAWERGDYANARPLLEESLTIRRELGDKSGLAGSLNNLGYGAWEQGDYANARALLEESLTIHRELGDKRGLAGSLSNLGHVAREQRDYASARPLYEESLAVSRDMGYTAGSAYALVHLGAVGHEQGEVGARALVGEGLRLYQDINDTLGIAIALGICAHIAVQWNTTEVGPSHSGVQRAVRLRGAAEALRESIGSPLSFIQRVELDKEMDVARAILGEQEFAAAWEKGRALSLEQAIDYALGNMGD